MKIKALLYCTKAKPYLVDFKGDYQTYSNGKELDELFDRGFNPNDIMNILNGKIAAECDYEVEEIGQHRQFLGFGYDLFFETETLEDLELQKKSCLDTRQLNSYFMSNADNGEKVGYAINIKNLHIFDEPRELNHYMVYDKSYDNMFGWEFDDEDKYNPLTKAPQNMMRVWLYENGEWVMYILISIRPEYLVDILNGNKTIEIRKKILNEMKEQI